MIDSSTTRPLQQIPVSSYRPTPMSWRERGVGIARIIFGLVWVVAALLQWLPQFQNTFVRQVAAAKAGQPGFIQGWISFWANLVSVNPLLFARMLATTETVIAAFLILPTRSHDRASTSSAGEDAQSFSAGSSSLLWVE